MFLIEPCCASKHWMAVRDAIGKSGTTLFEGYGDMSLAELLPAVMARYTEADMMIVAPAIPDQTAEALKKWMRRQWARMDGKGRVNVIARLTIVCDLSEERSPMVARWRSNPPFGGRLTLIHRQTTDTAILLPDMVIIGPVNLKYGQHFVATATTRPAHVADLWARFKALAETKEEED